MAINNKPIYVTQPSLPPLGEFVKSLEEIWDSKWLTNNGKFHQQLEKEMAEYLGVKYVSLFSNGTLALLTALQVLQITGEVITTPYTFVATTHSMLWNGLTPVFVDVDPVYGNLNPLKIEAAIGPKTKAIVPVHVYGNPVIVEKIQEVADIYNLKVIYDAAHAFGVEYKGQSILNFGDLSILSFHATKAYNTLEGGAIISHDEKTKKNIDYLKNFGFAGETTVMAPGINAKMNEVQAAYGLLQLKYLKGNILKAKKINEIYDKGFKGVEGIRHFPKHPDATYNYSYYPIFVDAKSYGRTRDELYSFLKSKNIYGRRYFYPLVSEFPMYKSLNSATPTNLPNAYKLSMQVICLPIYPELDSQTANEIVLNIKDYAKTR